MVYTENQWRIFWWINDNFPEYRSASPQKHLELIKIIEAYEKIPRMQ